MPEQIEYRDYLGNTQMNETKEGDLLNELSKDHTYYEDESL